TNFTQSNIQSNMHNTCSTLKLNLNLLADAKAVDAKKKGVATDQKISAKAALVHTCFVCRVSSIDPKTFKQHVESKYPKCPMVPVLVDVQAYTHSNGPTAGARLFHHSHSRKQNTVLNA
uniref:Uncharacterized protein n=1 Tax=Hucho hucho TaxID=62062 RepID=A0A4W5N021_9TELE